MKAIFQLTVILGTILVCRALKLKSCLLLIGHSYNKNYDGNDHD